MSWIDPTLIPRFATEETDTHRIYSEPDLWIERFAGDLLISHHSQVLAPAFLVEAEEWVHAANLPIQRIFSRHIPKQNPERSSPKLLVGDIALPKKGGVLERGLKYQVDFEAGYSCGFFIDQRANRAFLKRLAPARVLNCFAYTCSFSVVAAAAGAVTTNIDLSRKSLDRGILNFNLNDIPTEGHRFIADDVMDLLPRLARRNDKYDAIILDPPTFSRGNKGRRWQVEHNLGDLLLAALELADRECSILVSTNCSRISRRDLELTARTCVKAMRRRCDYHTESCPSDIPENLAPKTLWLGLS